MRDKNSETALSAKKAAALLCGFFPRSAASDPEIFLAGLTAVLDTFPSWVRERAVDPASGIPAEHSFLPDLAVVRKFCQALVDEKRKHDELIARYATKRIASDSHAMPAARNEATASALCERFGICGIPPGWDAIDVTRGAAKHGAGFPAFVDALLANPSQAPRSVFGRVADQARTAMDARMSDPPSMIDPPFGIGDAAE